jgi:FAD:protein FMN transferase
MNLVTVARTAMATRFEIVLHGPKETYLRAAAEAALDEIDRIEAQLSFFRATSQVSELNARAATGPVRVDPALFQFLQQAHQLHSLTDGAFDLTIGPLMRCWGFIQGTGQLPLPAALQAARDVTGMHLVHLNSADYTVRFERPGVLLDPGAIGKGYAIECAVEVLLDAGVESALIHGGTSTVRALGSPPGAKEWRVGLPQPRRTGIPTRKHTESTSERPIAESPLTTICLHDNALSVSAVWGKAFEAGGRTFGHVLDPRRGEPITGALMSAVMTKSATDADALSTALLVLGPSGQDRLHETWPDLQSLVISQPSDADPLHVSARGESWRGLEPKTCGPPCAP